MCSGQEEEQWEGWPEEEEMNAARPILAIVIIIGFNVQASRDPSTRRSSRAGSS